MKENIKTLWENLEKNQEEVNEYRNRVKNIALSLIKELLTDVNQTIEFDEDHYITVVYDGGRHPEYASNAFSTVESIYIKCDTIYIDTEDTSEYNVANNCSVDEIYNIVEMLMNQIEDGYEEC